VLLTPVHRGYATFGPANVQQDESYSNPLGLFLDDYVAALKEAGNVWAVKVVDLHADSGLMPNLRSQDAFISKVDTDRLHPSDAGHRLIADAVSLAVGGWLESK
jgi:lysophospholipase L1-like esterase